MKNRYPLVLFDVRASLHDGDLAAAIAMLVDCPAAWERWLTADELAMLRAAGWSCETPVPTSWEPQRPEGTRQTNA